MFKTELKTLGFTEDNLPPLEGDERIKLEAGEIMLKEWN